MRILEAVVGGLMFTIYNHLQSRTIAFNGQNVFLARHKIEQTDDKELAGYLSKEHGISVTEVIIKTRQELLHEAKERGIKVSLADTKDTLIHKLRGVN